MPSTILHTFVNFFKKGGFFHPLWNLFLPAPLPKKNLISCEVQLLRPKHHPLIFLIQAG